MKLELIRTYYPKGTNGKILYEGHLMVYTIELPWKNNLAASPEGGFVFILGGKMFYERSIKVYSIRKRKYFLIVSKEAIPGQINYRNFLIIFLYSMKSSGEMRIRVRIDKSRVILVKGQKII